MNITSISPRFLSPPASAPIPARRVKLMHYLYVTCMCCATSESLFTSSLMLLYPAKRLKGSMYRGTVKNTRFNTEYSGWFCTI